MKESRIAQEKIWFIEDLSIPEKRFKRVQEKARTHRTWKVQAQKKYEKACRKYLDQRIS
jgi:hypothetical protein